MHRRAFAGGLALAVLGTSRAGRAQPARGTFRLGMLVTTQRVDDVNVPTVLPTILREMGYVEGQNLAIERRYADGKLDRLPTLARELDRLRVHVILAISPASVEAARASGGNAPIVMFAAADPVARGWVASLGQPGGRVTGVIIEPDTQLTAKRLELLREAAPRAKRIAVLTTDETQAREQGDIAQRAAAKIGVTVVPVEAKNGEYGAAFERMRAERADALLVVSSAILNRDRRKIMDLAARHRMPAIYQWSHHADEGGLMSYGANLPALARRAAMYIDRIFKGATPATLPVEQPSTYELVINRTTARALGLSLSPGLSTRADRFVD